MIYFVSNQKIIESDDIRQSTIEDCLNYFRNHDSIAVDTETTGYDAHVDKLLCIQLGDGYNQYVLDYSSICIEDLKYYLETKEILMHNAQFDLRFFLKQNINIKRVYDTFLAECVLTTGYDNDERGLGLKDVVFKYCGLYLDKSIRGQIHWRGLDATVIRYSAYDVRDLHAIKKAQMVQITKLGLEKVLDLENKAVRVFARMAYDGIKLDTSKWLDVCKITKKQVEDLTKELDNIILTDPKLKQFIPQGNQLNLFGFEERRIDINWASNQQKLDILNALGLNVDSTGDRILQKNKKKHVLVSTLIKFNKMNKLATAFGEDFLKFVNPVTGRVHSSFWQILSTGRISVSDPNLNQIPSKGDLAKKIRAAFIPKNGCKIVGGDYSSFELAIIAELSRDPLWLKVLNEDGNLHSELCAATFKIPLDKVEDSFPPKPDLKYRDVQKTVDFGLAYGMSHFKLSDTLEISEDDAKTIINDFFNVVPQVKKFLDILGNFGKKYGYIETPPPFKRIRWFPQWKGKDTDLKVLGEIERASKNSPIQGSNANVIKLALVRVLDEIEKHELPISILLSIYDENLS